MKLAFQIEWFQQLFIFLIRTLDKQWEMKKKKEKLRGISQVPLEGEVVQLSVFQI